VIFSIEILGRDELAGNLQLMPTTISYDTGFIFLDYVREMRPPLVGDLSRKLACRPQAPLLLPISLSAAGRNGREEGWFQALVPFQLPSQTPSESCLQMPLKYLQSFDMINSKSPASFGELYDGDSDQ
jgi:hypothetical protein